CLDCDGCEGRLCASADGGDLSVRGEALTGDLNAVLVEVALRDLAGVSETFGSTSGASGPPSPSSSPSLVTSKDDEISWASSPRFTVTAKVIVPGSTAAGSPDWL